MPGAWSQRPRAEYRHLRQSCRRRCALQSPARLESGVACADAWQIAAQSTRRDRIGCFAPIRASNRFFRGDGWGLFLLFSFLLLCPLLLSCLLLSSLLLLGFRTQKPVAFVRLNPTK